MCSYSWLTSVSVCAVCVCVVSVSTAHQLYQFVGNHSARNFDLEAIALGSGRQKSPVGLVVWGESPPEAEPLFDIVYIF